MDDWGGGERERQKRERQKRERQKRERQKRRKAEERKAEEKGKIAERQTPSVSLRSPPPSGGRLKRHAPSNVDKAHYENL
ncbi:MAG: hypothetical protein R3Y11_07765, partial [Pseudomonadota bacterium]